MMNPNLAGLLNQRFECPACHSSLRWSGSTRAQVRLGSTIQGFQCRHCSEEIVVKVPRAVLASESGELLARDEYQALCDLQTAFPQDDRFGTLVPLGYLEEDGQCAIITRKFHGVDMLRYASRRSANQTKTLFRDAGVLLRKLHDCCPRGYEAKLLGVCEKVDFLTQTHGAELRRDAAMQRICGQFKEEAERLSALSLRATWGHGDFKPENILCGGHKYIILDTRLGNYGAFVYDLASFLNHLLIASRSSGIRAIHLRYDQAKEEFLAGYGGLNHEERGSLRWAQLYFMLCSWGRYRQRSPLAAIYANWKRRPLVQELAAQL